MKFTSEKQVFRAFFSAASTDIRLF